MARFAQFLRVAQFLLLSNRRSNNLTLQIRHLSNTSHHFARFERITYEDSQQIEIQVIWFQKQVAAWRNNACYYFTVSTICERDISIDY